MLFFVAYFQGEALKSVHVFDFLNNCYVSYAIATKFKEVIWRLVVIMIT